MPNFLRRSNPTVDNCVRYGGYNNGGKPISENIKYKGGVAMYDKYNKIIYTILTLICTIFRILTIFWK